MLSRFQLSFHRLKLTSAFKNHLREGWKDHFPYADDPSTISFLCLTDFSRKTHHLTPFAATWCSLTRWLLYKVPSYERLTSPPPRNTTRHRIADQQHQLTFLYTYFSHLTPTIPSRVYSRESSRPFSVALLSGTLIILNRKGWNCYGCIFLHGVNSKFFEMH